ncbi:hypothetical protein [Corallococcus exercitus]|uniref:hypothetical protein n=1 Tax=Corallococcus exercitus TaxID=2316736 RepID=UPI0035D4EBE4
MSLRSVLLTLVLTAVPPAFASDRSVIRPTDGLLADSAILPSGGSLRASAGGGAMTQPDTTDADSLASVSASLLWAPLPRLAAKVSGTLEGGRLSPSASLRYQLLSEDTLPLNLTLGARLMAVGMEGRGSEVMLTLAAGRTWGRLSATGQLALGQGFNGRYENDVEASSLLLVHLSDSFRVGAEARLRFEVEDEDTPGDVGRLYELMAGPSAALRLEPFELQALIGWSAPRALLPAGVAGMALLSLDL